MTALRSDAFARALGIDPDDDARARYNLADTLDDLGRSTKPPRTGLRMCGTTRRASGGGRHARAPLGGG